MHARILLLLFGDMGDTLLTLPAIRAIRSTFPDARIVLLTKPLPAEIVQGLNLVDGIEIIDKHLFDHPSALLLPHRWIRLARLALRLRRERFDTAVLFHHLVTRWGALKFASLVLAIGARERLGIDNGRGWFLTRSIVDRGFGAQHESQYYLDVAALLGAKGGPTLISPVSAADRESVRKTLSASGLLGRRLLVLHPGTGWYGPGRRWPAQSFARATNLILEHEDMECVIVGTRNEAAVAAEVMERLVCRATNLVGRTGIGELAALLELADIVIANDGGVAHLASAVGTPPVTVFGPSNEYAWRPLLGKVVAADIPCRPCFYRDFERGLPAGCPTRECMKLVTPRLVADAALTLLDERRVAV